MSPEQFMGFAILTPLIGAVLITTDGQTFERLSPALRRLRRCISSIAPRVTGINQPEERCDHYLEPYRSVKGFSTVTGNGQETWEGVWLAFEVEPLGMLHALVAAILWVPTSMYAVGYMRGHNEDNQTRFFACFAMAIFAALGIALRRTFHSLSFYEAPTFSTHPLVTHYGDAEAKSWSI